MARDVCRQIASCSDFISLTVRELDGFLKRTELPVELGPIAVGDVFEEAVTLLSPRLEAAVRVERPSPAEGPPRVVGDRRLLTHTLVNLLKNAVEAASAAGIEPAVTLSTRREGETTWIEVVDNGPGIAEVDLRRIFDDGFSTKGPGAGRAWRSSASPSGSRAGASRSRPGPPAGRCSRSGYRRRRRPRIVCLLLSAFCLQDQGRKQKAQSREDQRIWCWE